MHTLTLNDAGIQNRSTADIRLGLQTVWLGFATMRQYNPMAGHLFSPIYIYFHDPSTSSASSFDAVYEWPTGVTLSAALDSVFDIAHRSADRPSDLTLDKKQILAELRAATAL